MADEDSCTIRPLETTRGLHVAALAFVMLLPTAATFVYFVLLSGSPAMKVIYFASKIVQFAFPLIWVLAVQRRRVRPAWPDVESSVPGLAFGVLAVTAGLLAYFCYFKMSPPLERAPELIGGKVRDMGLTTPTVYFAFAAFLSLPHSLLEEYYWRWFVFGQLQRVTAVPAAIVLSSLAFMAHHVIVIHQFLHGSWTMTLFLSLCVALGGGVWAWLYHRYRSLYGPWLSHLLVDCGIMYIGYDLIPWP